MMWREVNTQPESRAPTGNVAQHDPGRASLPSPYFIGGFPVGMQRPVRENSGRPWCGSAQPHRHTTKKSARMADLQQQNFASAQSRDEADAERRLAES